MDEITSAERHPAERADQGVVLAEADIHFIRRFAVLPQVVTPRPVNYRLSDTTVSSSLIFLGWSMHCTVIPILVRATWGFRHVSRILC